MSIPQHTPSTRVGRGKERKEEKKKYVARIGLRVDLLKDLRKMLALSLEHEARCSAYVSQWVGRDSIEFWWRMIGVRTARYMHMLYVRK